MMIPQDYVIRCQAPGQLNYSLLVSYEIVDEDLGRYLPFAITSITDKMVLAGADIKDLHWSCHRVTRWREGF